MTTETQTDRPDWSARARREAAAILAEALPVSADPGDYTLMCELVAIGWLQGVNYGSHETLGIAESAFARLQADLA